MIALMTVIFIVGYAAIALEHNIKINKAASALITGVLIWTIYILFVPDKHLVNEQLTEHLGELAGILFFLLGAMTVVELIDAHNGFDVITEKITETNKRKLIWIISLLTFFLSPLLDNLTTTIVMVSLLRKLIKDDNDRLLFVGIVVIAANAGGAWSPIGDVTTTMLWIGGQVTAFNITSMLFLPSIVCLVIPILLIRKKLKGHIEPYEPELSTKHPLSERKQKIILYSGIIILMFVPVFKMVTHLPPYMGMLFGLGVLWIITVLVHGSTSEEGKHHYSVINALRRIDTASILFFLGILVGIAALQSSGILAVLSGKLSSTIQNESVIVMAIGLLSSLVDNVPLVAAAQGMYSLADYPTDHYFWEFLAYSAGTGGSALIIGSAAGVAAMGMEKIKFGWYVKNISWLALIGFFAGAFFYMLQFKLIH